MTVTERLRAVPNRGHARLAAAKGSKMSGRLIMLDDAVSRPRQKRGSKGSLRVCSWSSWGAPAARPASSLCTSCECIGSAFGVSGVWSSRGGAGSEGVLRSGRL